MKITCIAGVRDVREKCRLTLNRCSVTIRMQVFMARCFIALNAADFSKRISKTAKKTPTRENHGEQVVIVTYSIPLAAGKVKRKNERLLLL